MFFASITSQRLRRVRERHGRGTHGDDKVPFATFVWSLVVHALSAKESLGHHLRTVSGVDISDSAAIQRRQGLRWQWFEALFAYVLRPRAVRSKHADSFYHGYRLMGVDGSQWSLRNTAAITAQPRARHGNQRAGVAAFFKWATAVLIEVGTHQPLAAACESPDLQRAEGELNIARRVLGGVPKDEDTLLLADRLYGCGRFICDVQKKAGPRCQLLVRVSSSRKAKVITRLSDGSASVEVKVCAPGSTRTERKLRLREVRGWVWRQPKPGKEGEPSKPAVRVEVRLWTTLLDEQKYPAAELLALYAQRWEHELFYRELKRHVGREHLLRAGTMEGAEAEFGALIIAASLLAEQRLAAADTAGLPPQRISINKISLAMEHLLPVLSVAGDLLSDTQRQKLIERFMKHAAREAIIPPRRRRSCQRGVRKPQCSWPRIRTRINLTGSCNYEVISL